MIYISTPQQDTPETSTGRFDGSPNKRARDRPGSLYIQAYMAHCNMYINNIRTVIIQFTARTLARLLVALIIP